MCLMSLLAVLQALQSLDSCPTNAGKSLAVWHTITNTRVLPLHKRKWSKPTGDWRARKKDEFYTRDFPENLHFSLPHLPALLAVQLSSF